jgi:hypothetical protein
VTGCDQRYEICVHRYVAVKRVAVRIVVFGAQRKREEKSFCDSAATDERVRLWTHLLQRTQCASSPGILDRAGRDRSMRVPNIQHLYHHHLDSSHAWLNRFLWPKAYTSFLRVKYRSNTSSTMRLCTPIYGNHSIVQQGFRLATITPKHIWLERLGLCMQQGMQFPIDDYTYVFCAVMLSYRTEINCYFSVLCPNLWLFGEIVSQPDCISQLNEKNNLNNPSVYI